MFDDDLLPEIIAKRLAEHPLALEPEAYPKDFFDRPPKPAAVLMPLIREADGWHLLFIRRSEYEKDRHSGQVAFPGGHIDPSDKSAEAAALREAEEEIGLNPENVRLLGNLENYRTISNFSVTGVVGHVKRAFTPHPDPQEVQRVFSIPLEWLSDTGNLERRQRYLADFETATSVLYYRKYDNELLWGITARLVLGFVEHLGGIDLKKR